MKVSIKELKTIIDDAVAAKVKVELARILPGIMMKVLSEQFLKKLVAETTAPSRKASPVIRPSKLTELMQGDDEESWEEETPKAMHNDHKGIYHQNPLMRGKGSAQNESVRRRVTLADVMGGEPETVLRDPRDFQGEAQHEEDNYVPPAAESAFSGLPSELFEGTVAAGGSSNLGVTQQTFGEEGVPLDFLNKQLGVNFGTARKVATSERVSGEMAQTDEATLRALEMRRKALDVKVPQVR